MSTELDPTTKIDLLHQKARDLLRQKKQHTEIIAELQKEGIDGDYAQVIINNVFKDISNKKNFWKLLFSGLLIILAGVTLNLLSYRIAANSNSYVFYVFWGIFVTGIILIARAFIMFKK